MSDTYRWDYVDSPVGRLLVAVSDLGLASISFERDSVAVRPDEGWTHDPSAVDETRRQLGEYFARTRRAFDLPLDPRGTEFQRSVWDELCRIPFGSTASYREVALRIGRPKAVRAVGAANGRNPISIVVPCHRVIGADGSLTGFGGGLPVKRALLELEGSLAPELPLRGSRPSAARPLGA